ncbi:DUF4186 domain-containing protein [Bifidobacterium sp. 6T3]|uniref:DUF4186 domain-containing protein n=1 Tax=Bifidobacterium phasiani TaxID=2834431 RepID=A0ABS6W9E4_9BIFI|nr:DUF4186 domain-containing protein [Bifidobacterium phasiani]
MDRGQWIAQTLERLSHSAFRARFELSGKDRAYARAKGRDAIDRHTHEMLRSRVGAAVPRNDGRQTPWRGHPVFTAQHATATCCRGCIAKWHGIPQGRGLTDDEVDRLAALVMAWIERDLARYPSAAAPVGGTTMANAATSPSGGPPADGPASSAGNPASSSADESTSSAAGSPPLSEAGGGAFVAGALF